MRLYLVRRTRSFIEETYGERDPDTGRRYLPAAGGGRAYFTKRDAEEPSPSPSNESRPE